MAMAEDVTCKGLLKTNIIDIIMQKNYKYVHIPNASNLYAKFYLIGSMA